MIRTGALFFAVIAFLVGGSLASAQVGPFARPGISVTGRGTVRRPADIVRFIINVSNNTGRGTPADAMSGADELVRALKAAGVDEAVLGNPLNGMINAQRFVGVSGSLHEPTPDRVRALIATLATAMPSSTALATCARRLYGSTRRRRKSCPGRCARTCGARSGRVMSRWAP